MLQKYGSERLFSKYDNGIYTKTILKINPTKKLHLIDFLFASEHSILMVVLQENKSLEKHFDKFF